MPAAAFEVQMPPERGNGGGSTGAYQLVNCLFQPPAMASPLLEGTC